jgi:hypothetical protein
MRITLEDGYIAEFDDDGALLRVYTPAGTPAFSAPPPEFSAFYTFAEHAIHGNCPVVSFEPGHTRNGWPDRPLKQKCPCLRNKDATCHIRTSNP